MDSSRRARIGGYRVGIGIALALLCATAARAASGAEAHDPEASDPEGRVGTLFVKGEDGVATPAVVLATDVEIVVSGLVARARVSQRFSNESDLWLEGVYVFPLPEMAAVDRLQLTVGERRIEGQIQERARAKRTYQKAKSAGKTASLLEQERPNLFTTAVANIGPREAIEITLEYQQTLRYEKGEFELRFPMTLTSRYIPGAVPDAARITPWMLHPDGPVTNPLDLRVVLDAGFPLERISSVTHRLDVEQADEDRYEVWVSGVAADRDFVLRWRPERGHELRAALFSEERDGEHYVLLMLLPPDEEASASRIPREAIFVIDTSGSMGGASIEQAREALHVALERLDPEDTFNVIAFDDRPQPLFAASEPASFSQLRRAHRFVDRLEASGGTEMMAALERALHDPGEEGYRLRQVVFITDGSIGNETQLFSAIQRELGRTRLFTIGIGSAPNSYFLNRAAVFGRGTAIAIASQDEVRERMEDLFARIESPVLSDLEVQWNDEVEMWPARVPDLYAGEPLMVTARLSRFVGEVRLRGRRGDRPFEVSLPLSPGAPERGVHKLWARRKIAYWMGQRSAGVDAKEVREQVLAVAVEHEIVSRYTSLVAVDVTPRRPASVAVCRTQLANHVPAGSDPSRVPGVLPQGATPAPALLWLGSTALLLGAGLWRGAGRRA